MTQPERSRLNGLQALRAVACLAVLLQHVTYIACYGKSLDFSRYLPIDFGSIGVGLFFVLSGYVIGGCVNQGASFFVKRALRIFPPFWIAIALSGVILHWANTGWEFDFWSAFLLPSGQMNNSYRIPYWTLCYEMAFYIVVYAFIMLKMSRDHIVKASLFWLGLVIVFDAYQPVGMFGMMQSTISIPQPGWWILLSPMSTFFIFGLILSAIDLKVFAGIPTTYLVAASIVLWWVGTATKMGTIGPQIALLSASYCCALLASMRMEAPRFIARLGDFSYGAYLIHMSIIVAIEEALRPHAAHLRFAYLWAILMMAAFIGGNAFGWAEHMLHTKVFRQLAGVRIPIRRTRTR